MEQQNKNLSLIQVLRGIASLLVVLFHTTFNTNALLHKDFGFNIFLFGGSGVDIFFVLSGFIITYTSIKWASHPNKLLPFIRKRFVRIFPTYWIIITLFLLAQFLFPAFYSTHFEFNLLNILSTYLLLPGHIMVNGVSWTLTYELFFYILFSLVFLLPKKQWAFIFFALYACIVILIPIVSDGFEKSNGWLNLVSYPMNVEFFMGVLAAYLVPKIPYRASLPMIAAGSFCFIIGGLLYDGHYQLLSNTFNRVVFFGMPSFFIVLGLVKYELIKKIKVHSVFLSLGEASYSLYLLHLPVLVAAIKTMEKFNIRNTIFVHVILIGIIIIICFVAIRFYKWVEKPIIKKLNAGTKNKASLFTLAKRLP